MAKKKVISENSAKPRPEPASTPEARESQLISLAIDEAERQILEGTASSQIITHYLKLGSSRERLERDKLQAENDLLKAKVKALESAERMEALYEDALRAMTDYKGD